MLKGVEEEKYRVETPKGKKEKTVQKTYIQLKINGTETKDRVDVRELEVPGNVRVKGPVNVTSLDISGTANIKGPINCEGSINVSGKLRTPGDVTAEEVVSTGELQMRNCKSNLFSTRGQAYIEEKLTSDKIQESGSIRTKEIECLDLSFSGSITANKIEGHRIEIRGVLDCEDIKANKFTLESDSTISAVNNVEADHVKITMRKGVFPAVHHVKIDTIKGKIVEVQDVVTDSIIADKVIIGNNCIVNYVEAESIELSKDATVIEQATRHRVSAV